MSHAIVRVSREVLEAARAEARLLNRSAGAQVDHWARIGRVVEASPAFDYARVRAALAGDLSQARLTAVEDAVFFDALDEAMAAPMPQELAFFENLRAEGGGVGLDEAGTLVRGLPGGGVEPIDEKPAPAKRARDRKRSA